MAIPVVDGLIKLGGTWLEGKTAKTKAKAEAEAAEKDPIALLMKQALDGVVSLPWTLMLDKWRSGVFTGEITEDNLNSSWWELREKYQGITSPMPRGEEYFDPGAKYHIPGNTPYTRYYLARIMQYQFHEALCNEMDFEGPLHECSIYNNPEVGIKIRNMLALGQSKPWQDAFEALTGDRALSGQKVFLWRILDLLEKLQFFLYSHDDQIPIHFYLEV